MCASLLHAPALASAEEQSSDEVKVVIGDEVFVPGNLKPQKTVCSDKDSEQSIQHSTALDYAADGSGLVPGISRLRCGNAKWGLRHIDAGHGDGKDGGHSWRNIVQKHMPPGTGWEEFMVFAYKAILGDPSYSSYAEDNDSYRYTAPVKIIQNGKVKRTYRPLILVPADSYNVITAYPRK